MHCLCFKKSPCRGLKLLTSISRSGGLSAFCVAFSEQLPTLHRRAQSSKVGGTRDGEAEESEEEGRLREEVRWKLKKAGTTARELKSIKKLTKPSTLSEAPSLEEHIWRPLGVGLLAEAQIQDSIRRGTFQNLKGKGKPLPKEDHGAQFFSTDPTLHAIMRTVGAQGLRPASIDRRDALKQARDRLASRVRHLAQAGGVQLADMRAGRDDAATFLFHEVERAILAYNDALLKDKETYPGWPLIAFPKLDLQKEVERMLAEEEKETKLL